MHECEGCGWRAADAWQLQVELQPSFKQVCVCCWVGLCGCRCVGCGQPRPGTLSEWPGCRRGCKCLARCTSSSSTFRRLSLSHLPDSQFVKQFPRPGFCVLRCLFLVRHSFPPSPSAYCQLVSQFCASTSLQRPRVDGKVPGSKRGCFTDRSRVGGGLVGVFQHACARHAAALRALYQAAGSQRRKTRRQQQQRRVIEAAATQM